MQGERITVVGAGIGGLVAAVDLARHGMQVTVLEAAATPGGKMSEVRLDGRSIDAGPTVLTMRWVFDELFDDCGSRLEDWIKLDSLFVLARHFWRDTEPLDLYSSLECSADAIGRFAGPSAARGYRAFCMRAAEAYYLLEEAFMRRPCANAAALVASVGMEGLRRLWRIAPFSSLNAVLREYFDDPRLLQLFGRYATYCGSSPYLAPASLMVVAHVEREGVWTVAGGMHRLAQALVGLGTKLGVSFRFNAPVDAIELDKGRPSSVVLRQGERIFADAIVVAADAAALASGLFGRAVQGSVAACVAENRSLSAVTWAMQARLGGVSLGRHNVFFSEDYPAEFKQIFRDERLPDSPTVYVCAQDRGEPDEGSTVTMERLFCIVNAPAMGDRRRLNLEEIAACESRTFNQLRDCGLTLMHSPDRTVCSTPSQFHERFPGTGGALYGQNSHGWRATFRRPGARTKIAGLYLAGGSTHPGPGVPMAALSGRLAAQAVIADRTSNARFHPVATPGGTLTHKVTTTRRR
ncbi:MAG: 1-hydroxycarotenoid 3,4-desaturase CrtD [Burkholderiaceae bacterium]|jgi:1-hydroxycarotenoid 3,4-desaturase